VAAKCPDMKVLSCTGAKNGTEGPHMRGGKKGFCAWVWRENPGRMKKG